MFGGRVMPRLLDVSLWISRRTEQGQQDGHVVPCFTFLRGSDVVELKQEEKESKMLKLEGTLGTKPW